jgi:hypothetical protein
MLRAVSLAQARVNLHHMHLWSAPWAPCPPGPELIAQVRMDDIARATQVSAVTVTRDDSPRQTRQVDMHVTLS